MDSKLCECGCGIQIPAFVKAGKPRRFVKGHQMRQPEIRENHSRVLSGRTKSKSHREALSEASKAWWDSLSSDEQESIRQAGRDGRSRVDEDKRKNAARLATLGKPRSKSERERISKGHIGVRPNQETRQKMSQSRKRYFLENPDAKEYLRQKRLNQIVPQRDTSIEIAIQEELKNLGIDFETHIPLLGICEPDILIRQSNLVIQADGDYWHSLPEVKNRDDRQDTILTSSGYTVLRFSESSIKQDATLCALIVQAILKGIK